MNLLFDLSFPLVLPFWRLLVTSLPGPAGLLLYTAGRYLRPGRAGAAGVGEESSGAAGDPRPEPPGRCSARPGEAMRRVIASPT